MSAHETVGVDYSFSKPDPALLARSGYKFALRYLSHDPGKNLTGAELKALWAHGISVGVVWESAGGRALQGEQAGVEDARAAKAQADALGLSDIPIFFAVDFDVAPGQKPTMGRYFKGAVSVLGDRARCYGGYYALKYLVEKRIAGPVHWQTSAWSGGQWHPSAGIQQYKNGVSTAGGTVDLNRANTAGLACLRGPHAKPSRRQDDERKLREWEKELHGIHEEADLRRKYGSKHPWTLAMRRRGRKLEKLIRRQQERLRKQDAKSAKAVDAALRPKAELREKGTALPTNRVVILLSPVFVGLSGWVVELAAKYLPGHPNLDKGQLTAVFIAGATFAAGKVALWLHGWQKGAP